MTAPEARRQKYDPMGGLLEGASLLLLLLLLAVVQGVVIANSGLPCVMPVPVTCLALTGGCASAAAAVPNVTVLGGQCSKAQCLLVVHAAHTLRNCVMLFTGIWLPMFAT